MESDKFLQFGEVRAICGLSRTTIWRREKTGDFPKRRQIGIGRVAWLKSEIETWMSDCPAVGNIKVEGETARWK